MNKQKIWALTTTLTQLLAFTICSYAATPSISTVSGTISNGQNITITGTNLEQENVTNWDANFKSGSSPSNVSTFEGASLSASGWDNNTHNGEALYGTAFNSGVGNCSTSTAFALTGSKSCDVHFGGTDTGNGNNEAILDIYNPIIQNPYCRVYALWYNVPTGTWPDSSFKFFCDYFSPSNVAILEPAMPGNGGAPTGWGGNSENCAGGNLTSGTVGSPIVQGRWYCVEIGFTASGTKVWVDGVEIINDTSTCSYSSSGSGIELGCTNFEGTHSNFVCDIYLDNFAVSTTRVYPSSKIEVSNNSTYGSGTVNYCAPVSISDTSVQATLNLTGLGSGPYYLWVTNNSQNISSAYQLGSGSVTTPPATPTGVTIQILP